MKSRDRKKALAGGQPFRLFSVDEISVGGELFRMFYVDEIRRVAVPSAGFGNVCYPWSMEITLNIPDELARQVTPEGEDPARVALEALALEGYRAERLSESAVRQMLGFESRIQVHAFLKQHGVYLHYDIADLEQDHVTAEKLRGRSHDESASGKRRSE